MDLIPRAEYFHSPVCPHGCLAAGCKPELCHVNFIRFGWFQRTVQALTSEGPVHVGGGNYPLVVSSCVLQEDSIVCA